MGKKDKRVDAYIDQAADFAKPILLHLRKLVHEACPETEETIKWGFPNFEYQGIMCNMAAFKQHCAFGFWKASLLPGLSAKGESGMGNLGQLKKLSDLPPDKTMLQYIKAAMKLNESGAKVVRKTVAAADKVVKVPAFFKDALSKDKNVFLNFQNFSYSEKKDYVEWVTEAKTEITRDKRIRTSLEWIGEGKRRNWKYERK